MTWLKHLFWEREREGAYGCAICCVSVESTSQPSKKDELATFVKTKGGGGGICLKSTRLRSKTCANGPPSRELASRSFHTTYLPILVLFRYIAFLSSPPSRIPLYTWPTLPTLSPFRRHPTIRLCLASSITFPLLERRQPDDRNEQPFATEPRCTMDAFFRYCFH